MNIGKIRRQLTLFLDPKDALTIEQVRAKFNPAQSKLIKSHVTLCREDEIVNIQKLTANLTRHKYSEIVLEFGKAIRFDEGKGVLLPSCSDNISFHKLRRQVLNGFFEHPRLLDPHITLMHPRNSTCTDATYNEIYHINFPAKFVFKKIDLIEQINGGKWKILKSFPLITEEQL